MVHLQSLRRTRGCTKIDLSKNDCLDPVGPLTAFTHWLRRDSSVVWTILIAYALGSTLMTVITLSPVVNAAESID